MTALISRRTYSVPKILRNDCAVLHLSLQRSPDFFCETRKIAEQLDLRRGSPHVIAVLLLFGWSVFLMLTLHILEFAIRALALLWMGLIPHLYDAIYFCANMLRRRFTSAEFLFCKLLMSFVSVG